MFAVGSECTKIVRLGCIFGNVLTRSFCVKSKLKRAILKQDNLFARTYLFKQFSSDGVNEADGDCKEQEINYAAITDGNKELEHKLKVIALEAEVMRQEGKSVPSISFLTVNHWKELLNFESRSGRRKYLEYLFKLSKTKENRLAKKAEKKLQWEEFKSNQEPKKNIKETIEEFAMKYDLQHNSIFLRFYESTIMQFYNNRLIQAMRFGQKLVIDCGYDVNMSRRENLNCSKQLMLLFAENRMHDEPFDLHYCNTNPESDLIKSLHRYIPTMYEPSFPLNIHEPSYLDLFPKDQLVYLTPHCREELLEFDHDAIYIVGAIVDKINNEPLSLAKAKKEGLKMAKFPLDRYLQWGSGSGKSLTLNQVASILLDIKCTGDWKYALRHVPRRKLVEYNIGKNISDATNTLRFDKPRREKRWVPSSNIEFGNLGLNQYNNSEHPEKDSSVHVKKKIINK